MRYLLFCFIFLQISLYAVEYKKLDLNEGDTFCPPGESQCYLLGGCSRTSYRNIYDHLCETSGYWFTSDFKIIESSCLYGYTNKYNVNYYSVLHCENNLPVSNCPDGTSPDADGVCVAQSSPECSDNEFLNENNECVPLAVPDPDNFPTSENNATDNATNDGSSSSSGSNGSTSIQNLPTPEDNCIPGTTFTSSMGVYQIIGWDYATNKCKTAIFRCNSGYIFDESTKSCKLPPDELTTTNDGSNSADSACPGGKFAQRWTYNFCDKCRGDIGVWLPPVGLENYGLQCNRKYIEYDCIKDYRIKKFVEVSCGNVPPPEDPVTHEINMDELTDSDVKDTNVSNLPAIDPTKANTELNSRLDLINDSIAKKLFPEAKATNAKLDSVNSNLKGLQGSVNNAVSALGSIDGKLNGVNDGLNDVKGSLDGIKNDDGSGFDVDTLKGSNFGLDDTAMTDDSGFLDELEDNVKFITDEVVGVKDDFEDTVNLIKGTPISIKVPSGSCSDINLQKFGFYIAPFSPIMALVTYIGMMIGILRFVFVYLSRGESS